MKKDGGTFKVSIAHSPYFYVASTNPQHYEETSNYLLRKYDSEIAKIEVIPKEDLQLV
jgi:hypothetical protein